MSKMKYFKVGGEVEKASDAKHFRELIETEPKRPVLYRMSTEERFKAHGKWDSQYFAQLPGEVNTHESKSSSFFNIVGDSIWDLAQMFLLRKCTWPELMDKIQRKDNVIMSGTDCHLRLVDGTVAEKWKDCWNDVREGLDEFVPGGTNSETMDRVGLWLSGPKISSQTHWDANGDNNLNFQIRGKKRFLLWEPMDGQEHLYPLPFRFWHISRIPDPYHVDLKQYPMYKYSRPLKAEMDEGDVLFIPARWWHHVSHDGDFNANVTAWYHSQYHGRRPHLVKSFCVPRALLGIFYLLKVIWTVLIVLYMILCRKICGYD